jgi:hypothetical protein
VSVSQQSDGCAKFELGYRLGSGTGYEVGWAHGFAACEREWQAFLGVYRQAVRTPRRAELERAREFRPGEPCVMNCRRCSKCVHSLAYWRRGGRDYLPGDAA